MLDENEEFVRVSGNYRVYDLKVYNSKTGKYAPLDLDKTYTLAASNYFLLEFGSGMKMLESAKVIQNDGMLDVEAVERYVTEVLGGEIGQQYQAAEPNITFTEGEHSASGSANAVLWIAGAVVVLILLLAVVWAVKKAKANKAAK